MTNSKVISILRTLSRKEFKELEKFAASPFFNKGRNFVPLLKILKEYHPEFGGNNVTYEKIYSKLHPGRKYNRQVMWNYCSLLEKLCKDYLIQVSLQSYNVEKFDMLYKELVNRGLSKSCIKLVNEIERKTSSSKLGKDLFYTQNIIETAKADFFMSKGTPGKSHSSINKSAEYLLINFLIELSVQLWDLKVMEKMYNAPKYPILSLIKDIDLNSLISGFEDVNHQYAHIMRFYYNKIMCVIYEDEIKYFVELKDYFEKNHNKFELNEKKNLLITMANYCANNIRNGKTEFTRLLFEINCLRIKENLAYTTGGIINKPLFHQIVTNALDLREFKWAESFINSYAQKLNKEHKLAAEYLAYANLYFNKSEFQNALKYLQISELKDIRDKIHVRILTLQCHYELGNDELLRYQLDSSKHFVSKSKEIEETAKRNALSFFGHISGLLKMKDKDMDFERSRLKSKILTDKYLRLKHKTWLLKKIEHLK